MLAMIIFVLTACRGNEHFSDKFEVIKTEGINRIVVSCFPKRFESIELTDVSEIESIILFINSISKVKVSNPSEAYVGGGYLIELYSNACEINKLWLSVDMLADLDNDFTFEVPCDEGASFDALIGTIILNRYRDERDGVTLVGKVLSVVFAESGQSIVCDVESSDGTITTVDLNFAKPIIDITGAGWLILHSGDMVEMGIDDRYFADMVFIILSSTQ